jgi:hypothetical protein
MPVAGLTRLLTAWTSLSPAGLTCGSVEELRFARGGAAGRECGPLSKDARAVAVTAKRVDPCVHACPGLVLLVRSPEERGVPQPAPGMYSRVADTPQSERVVGA